MREAALVLAVLLGLLVSTVTLAAQTRPGGRFSWSTRSECFGRACMAATSQPLATQAALAILDAGGNAVDAAIAANAVLCVTEPTGCGLGGDLFAIVWDGPTEKLHGLEAAGRSPRALTREVLATGGRTHIPPHGPLPITVPGCVDGWFTLHARFGRLPMADVLAPAIRHAESGFAVTPVIAHHWHLGARVLQDEPGFAAVFTPGGKPPAAGDVFRNQALARTLATLAEAGRDAFYAGSIGKSLVAFVREHGGYLSEEDLREHHSDWIAPVSVNYRGYEVWELPPPGQGIAALQILNLLSGFDVAKLGFGSVETLHLLIEAKKLAFADRARFYADPAFVTVPVKGLLAADYAAAQRRRIDPTHAMASVEPGNPAAKDGDTVYLTVADREGTMVSLIQSNFRGFGSGITPPDLGFCLQDRGELFDLAPGKANSFAPGKRPFHTIIPAFVTRDGVPFLSFGVMGGDMQPQGHVQILMNIIDFGMTLQEAGDAPRVRHEGSTAPTGETMRDGGEVLVEPGVSADVLDALRARGHRVRVSPGDGGFGGYQAIGFDAARGLYVGASESRKDGCALGR
ncbi:MAG: gamma-glutamyltransferase [Planctomycetota bacterium]